jgi:hypothetical protein
MQRSSTRTGSPSAAQADHVYVVAARQRRRLREFDGAVHKAGGGGVRRTNGCADEELEIGDVSLNGDG